MDKKRIVFCDFDGTITQNDNIVAIMKHFNPPGWEELVQQLMDGKLSIRQTVGRMFAMLPTSRQAEIVDYAIHNATIRSGFGAFVDYCKEREITLLVTSGGIDFFIYPLLAPFPIPREHIYSNASSFAGDTIEILWPNGCDEHCDNDCGMCKTTIIRSYDPARYHRILIGDSVTDFAGAKLVDTVFARSHLIGLCEELELPFYPFETFYDVMKHLEAMDKHETDIGG
ncbi:2-hydroxy-3-keto-5-methylthiopentenyl-1-phosphate phosphatase [Paenibacillus athensensis]|uniref:2-hydroxy-3-keto-5-methylthiopentenyl-1-phosphate phosphatase n=1 Tax=Paenibacillus athensensis TaxID=1967502 RepID=A0A4Y8QA59_9BACL|nr:2-hydroxy-3-keto-5-methylthiopentenyl-1-phosphate phosphatase [Paenibacillus athensensis]MCD1260281.1 2-hydroxy-3-keto-5-methylthiopentenyl-1-phosphate phosphatase [Paenibacillus athensensis]